MRHKLHDPGLRQTQPRHAILYYAVKFMLTGTFLPLSPWEREQRHWTQQTVTFMLTLHYAMKRQATQVRVPQPVHSPTQQRRGQITRLCEVIAQEFQPEKIILFGSWAYGKPDTDSDIDLLVVMPFEGSPFRQAGTILNRVIQSVGVLPLDLLVRTAEQSHERLALGDGFVRDILERGKVLYEADHA